ncbi:MAG: hypothetical protein HY033_10455 [Ignavibacteriae bacterium]|nr:hypothetical protein [Ignavibacteriota bacterium]
MGQFEMCVVEDLFIQRAQLQTSRHAELGSASILSMPGSDPDQKHVGTTMKLSDSESSSE